MTAVSGMRAGAVIARACELRHGCRVHVVPATWMGHPRRIRGQAAAPLRALRQPVLAVADRASSIAPIGVQFVKYVLHPLNGTGCLAWGARYRHRNRRGFGTGRPPWL